jgi:CRP/FNR family transcriptional regulator
MVNKLKENYGFLLEEELLKEIEAIGTFKEIPAGETFIRIGDQLTAIPLVISGAMKVFRIDGNDDEHILYFIETGDSCAMSLACCVNGTKSNIRAVAETNTEIVLIPSSKMDEWLVKYKSWRSYILDSYNVRLNELLETIDSLVFMNMEERLMKYLSDKVKIKQDTTLEITHQEIALELHTSRVVISRLLKKLENAGSIKLFRNKIEVLNF